MARFAVSFILLVFAALPALAQEVESLQGHWVITSLDENHQDFSGEIIITPTDEPGVFRGDLIMQDSCCGGNFARVRQSSMIRIIDDQIFVWSKIEEFLEQVEVTPGTTFIADNFRMRWADENTLMGVSGSQLPVIWQRREAGLV